MKELFFKTYACAVGSHEVEVWIDGEKIGSLKNVREPWDWYGLKKGVKLKKGKHQLTLKFSSNVFLDKVFLEQKGS